MICTKCKIDKPITDFYNGKKRSCKACQMTYQKKYRASPLYKEKSRIYFAKWNKENYSKRTSYIQEATYKWKEDHPGAMIAYLKVYRAVKHGVLKRPYRCEKCNISRRLCAHHKDYSKPLEVMWLCWSCHRREHNI